MQLTNVRIFRIFLSSDVDPQTSGLVGQKPALYLRGIWQTSHTCTNIMSLMSNMLNINAYILYVCGCIVVYLSMMYLILFNYVYMYIYPDSCIDVICICIYLFLKVYWLYHNSISKTYTLDCRTPHAVFVLGRRPRAWRCLGLAA